MLCWPEEFYTLLGTCYIKGSTVKEWDFSRYTLKYLHSLLDLDTLLIKATTRTVPRVIFIISSSSQTLAHVNCTQYLQIYLQYTRTIYTHNNNNNNNNIVYTKMRQKLMNCQDQNALPWQQPKRKAYLQIQCTDK